MENYYVKGHSMGPRDLRRNERVHRQGDSRAAKENHSHRFGHHHYGNSARGIGVRTKPPQPHDLRIEKLSLPFFAPPRSGKAFPGPRGVFSRERTGGGRKGG